MAKKPKVNKTQAVKDYLKGHPKAVSSQIAAALTKRGIKITPSYVANIKTTINKTRTAKTAAKRRAKAVAAAPAAVDKTPADTITLEQVRKVAQTIKTLGGYNGLTEMLEVIKELGGVKKFKDLAEAMTVTEADCVPF
jgi:hypothetical protein